MFVTSKVYVLITNFPIKCKLSVAAKFSLTNLLFLLTALPAAFYY